jgi:hypothetical protein
MDFITLANAAHDTSRSLLRVLTAESEDDDFAHLENVEHASAGADTVGGAGTESGATIGGEGMENRPLLSPTAEAALLELSTNFLLCEYLWFLCRICLSCAQCT